MPECADIISERGREIVERSARMDADTSLRETSLFYIGPSGGFLTATIRSIVVPLH